MKAVIMLYLLFYPVFFTYEISVHLMMPHSWLFARNI